MKYTPYGVLPTAVYDHSRWHKDETAYTEEDTECKDEKEQLASKFIQAQDQALYWTDSEIVFLRQKWDDTLGRNAQLERENSHLEFFLNEAHRRNIQITEWGLAATRASTERAALEIATLKARLEATQTALRESAVAAREDRLRPREKEYLVESLGAACIDYQTRLWGLEERLT